MRGANSANKLIALAGNRVTCDCCGRRSGRYLPFGQPPRPHARCVYCGSLERHRTLWPHLQHTIKPGDRVLHFSPEPIICRNIATLMQVRYTAADLNPSNSWLADHFPIVRADITDQPWPDESFDVVIVSHVLEWVRDDALAMQELRRVVADDGVVVSQEPHDPMLETTCEYATVTGPEPAVRMYGRDLMSRWRQAGFEVQTFRSEAGAGNEISEARPR
jgi:SAM-dependent methyltransferase